MARAPFTTMKWTTVAFLCCILFLVIGLPIEYVLWPDWSWQIGAGWNFGWLDTWVIAMVVGVMAIDAYLRAHTRILMTTEGTFTLAYYSPKNLLSRNYKLDQATIKKVMQLNGLVDREGKPVNGMVMPTASSVGKDGKSRPVKLIALVLGGVDHGGIHLKGRDGILLVEGGEEEFIRFGLAHKGISVILPRLLVRMRHDQVDPEVMNQLRLIDTFKEGKTPIFRATVFDPGLIEYLRYHADVFLPILQNVDQTKITSGRPDETYLWLENMVKQARITSLEHEVGNLTDANRNYSDIIAGRASKLARSYRRDADTDPNLVASRSTPLESTD